MRKMELYGKMWFYFFTDFGFGVKKYDGKYKDICREIVRLTRQQFSDRASNDITNSIGFNLLEKLEIPAETGFQTRNLHDLLQNKDVQLLHLK